MQRLGVPEALQLSLIVETNGVDNQRFSFPMSDRVAKPAWIRIDGMRATVGRDDAERSGIFMEDRDVIHTLKDLELIRYSPRLRRYKRHAVCRRSGVVGGTCDPEFLRTGFQDRTGG